MPIRNQGFPTRTRVALWPGASSEFLKSAFAAVALLSLAGCQPMSHSQELGMGPESNGSKVSIATHAFGAHCFGGFGCQVRYDRKFIRDRPQSEANPEIPDDGYEDRLIAPYVGIESFPLPAQVVWRAADGSALSAEIDIAAVVGKWFMRKERSYVLQPGALSPAEPEVFLVVVDRTVNVLIRDPADEQLSPDSGLSRKVDVAFSKTY